MTSPDVIVLGLGGMGSAACYHLARRGCRVLGLDAYHRGHANGSSHGRSRIIREAYYESPHYVTLVQRAYQLWRSLENETGQQLLTITGGLWVGAPDSQVVAGALESARLHALPHEPLAASEIRTRWPVFRFPQEFAGIYEPGAGILDPEACVAAHLDRAAAMGANLRHNEPVVGWTDDGNSVTVETTLASYRSGRLVVAAGAWAGRLLAELRLPIEVERVFLVHFEPDDAARFAAGRCPLYLWQCPTGIYYGFPWLPGQGIKFGKHGGGEITTPEQARREVTTGEIEEVQAMLDRYAPGAARTVRSTVTCLYVNTPDEHFILDRHPEFPNLTIAAGFCGHGFKFASAVGEVVADLTLEGQTRQPVNFLRLGRFAATRGGSQDAIR